MRLRPGAGDLGDLLMPRAHWNLHSGRPTIEVFLTLKSSGRSIPRQLLADSGAGTDRSGFDILLDNQDCRDCGGSPIQPVNLGGAFSGSFPVYLLRVRIPSLAFDRRVPAVGVPRCPTGFEGIACFRFLNRFTYGNFGDIGSFGLEN